MRPLRQCQNTNIHIIRVPEAENRKKGAENLVEEITAENFPDLKKETYPDTGRKEKKSQKEEVKRQSL